MIRAVACVLLLLALCLPPLAVGEDAPPVVPDVPSAGAVRLTFIGRIEGSERIVIDERGARWENVFWGTSRDAVLLNGISWSPSKSPTLPNRGATAFLPAGVDFASARLDGGWWGRDTVALFPAADALTVRIADNPNGNAVYAFTVLFDARPPPCPELVIQATIDGSDTLHLSPRGARWQARHWGGARDIALNGVPWQPAEGAWLANDGATRFLPEDVDLGAARVTSVSGRDLAAIEVTPEGLLVRFADTPVGADRYEMRIRFGP